MVNVRGIERNLFDLMMALGQIETYLYSTDVMDDSLHNKFKELNELINNTKHLCEGDKKLSDL